jgi:hypothetical protein
MCVCVCACVYACVCQRATFHLRCHFWETQQIDKTPLLPPPPSHSPNPFPPRVRPLRSALHRAQLSSMLRTPASFQRYPCLSRRCLSPLPPFSVSSARMPTLGELCLPRTFEGFFCLLCHCEAGETRNVFSCQRMCSLANLRSFWRPRASRSSSSRHRLNHGKT